MARPIVYVFSQLNVDKITNALPKHFIVKLVKPSDQKYGFDWHLKVSSQDLETLKDAEIMICDNSLLAQIMYSLPKVKWVQGMWAGVDHIVKAIDKTKPLPSFILTRCSTNYFGDAMGDYAMAQIVNFTRDFYKAWEFQKLKQWKNECFLNNLTTLRDMTIGILGAGVIGSSVAKAFKQKGSRVLGFARTPRDKATYEKMGYDNLVCDIRELLPHCDVICNFLPDTHLTRGLLNGDVLMICAKKPIFLNVGRGSIIKEKDLIAALNNGWLSGAILDVFEVEPLPESSPLWTMPNVIVTPHIAGITRLEDVAEIFTENYQRYVNGQDMINMVDWEREY